jgi:predicted DNA binding CopG/RHH family protein
MKNQKRGRASHGNKSKMISIRFPVELLEAAKAECAENGLSFSSVLINLVRQWMEENNG